MNQTKQVIQDAVARGLKIEFLVGGEWIVAEPNSISFADKAVSFQDAATKAVYVVPLEGLVFRFSKV